VGSVNRFVPQECVSAVQGSFKVIDYRTNRKRVCDFLLVRHSNLGPILLRFRAIVAFVLMTPPLFHPNFRVFLLDQIADVDDDDDDDERMYFNVA